MYFQHEALCLPFGIKESKMLIKELIVYIYTLILETDINNYNYLYLYNIINTMDTRNNCHKPVLPGKSRRGHLSWSRSFPGK